LECLSNDFQAERHAATLALRFARGLDGTRSFCPSSIILARWGLHSAL
jgi:hypothetical protein